MTLAIAATGNGDGTVDLVVSGAAHVGTAVYVSNFASSVDSWAGATSGSHTAPDCGYGVVDGVKVLKAGYTVPWLYNDQRIQRTVSGMTTSNHYRVKLRARAAPGTGTGLFAIKMTSAVEGQSDYFAVSESGWTEAYWDFTAPSASQTLQILRQNGAGASKIMVREVRVTLIDAGYGPLQIQRTDANGTRYVRLPADAEPNSSGTLLVEDNEASLTGALTYVVRDGLGYTAEDIVFADSQEATNPAWDTETQQAWSVLSQVGLSGETNVAIPVFESYDGARTFQELTRDVKAVIGREDFTSVVTGDYGWTLRQGRLRFLCPAAEAPANEYGANQNRSNISLERAQAIADLYASGRVTLLRQASYLRSPLDLYHVAKNVKVVPDHLEPARQHPTMPLEMAGFTRTSQIWACEVDYLEVAWPEGALVGALDWTYDALSGSYLAYWNVSGDFTTYATLKTGVPG